MKRTTTVRRACWIGLAILSIGSGCTHNYYYGAVPGCPPMGQTVTTQVGQVCEVPSETIIPGGTNPQVASVPNAQRIVISHPAYSPSFASRWRRTTTESLSTNRSEGALEDTTIKK